MRTSGSFLLLMALVVAGCQISPWTPGKTANGVHYEVKGDGPGAIIFVHAFSMDSRMWAGQEALFPEGFRVVRYDLRGHGQSVAWTEPFSAVEDLKDVMNEVGIAQAVLVGLSSGAETAVDFSLAHPERVARLVLASPSVGGYQPEGSFDFMGPVMEALQAQDFEQAAARWAETKLMKVPDARQQTAIAQMSLDNAAIWTYDPTLHRRPEMLAIERLGEIQQPALILVGEEDLVDTHRVGMLLADSLANAEHVVVPEAGHMINMAAPEAFNQLLQSFLSE